MARVLLRLRCESDCAYNNAYYSKLQGFVYGLLKGTVFETLHDKKGYKYFCFSNVFPYADVFRAGMFKSLIISSPSMDFVGVLREKLKGLVGQVFSIGEMRFVLDSFSVVKSCVSSNCVIRSATSLVFRIPERNYDFYNVPVEDRKQGFLFWRPKYSFDAFVNQLESNLVKKFNGFYGVNLKSSGVFEDFRFVDSLVNHVVIDGRERQVVGSLWEFSFGKLSGEQKRLLNFGLDAGLGERNSYGFGFMNVVKKN